MKAGIFRLASLCLALVVVLALPLAAQMHQGQNGGAPRYDPKTEITVSGTIEEVKQLPSPGRGGEGTHLMVKTDKETFDVHVGPAWFLKDHNYSFAKGDHVEVIGSKVQFAGSDALIAREIKKGSETITLRDIQGIPAWSRRKG